MRPGHVLTGAQQTNLPEQELPARENSVSLSSQSSAWRKAEGQYLEFTESKENVFGYSDDDNPQTTETLIGNAE